jgi:hypothetical protein
MPFNRNAGGDAFRFSDDVCDKCGMTRPYFEDNGEPRCTGQKPEPLENIRDEDDDEAKPAR